MSHATETEALRTAGNRRERAALLKLHLDELIERERAPVWRSVVLAGLEWTATATSALAMSADPELFLPFTAGFGVTAIAATVSIASSEDTRRDVLASVGFLPVASGLLGASLAESDGELAVPRLSLGALAGGYYAAALLSAVNAIGTGGAPLPTLRRHAAKLAAPTGRAQTTERELVRMEADFTSREPLLPFWLVMAPLGVAGAIAFVPAFEEDRSDAERVWSVALGSLGLLSALESAFHVHPVAAYGNDIHQLQLGLVPMGNGVAVVGRF